MNNIKITNTQKDHVTHVVGESDSNCFRWLWVLLEWDLDDDFMEPLPILRSLSQRYLGLDAKFDNDTMILTIGDKQLEALNDMLNFVGYGSIEESEYDLDITVK